MALRVWGRTQADHTQLLSAGVAFWALLSLIPAMIAAITVFGLVLSPQEVSSRLEGFLDAVPSESRDLVRSQLESIAGSSSTALSLGLVTSLAAALWAASTGMANLMQAINIVYDERDERNWFARRGIALGLTLGAIVFVGVSLIGITAVRPLVERADLGGAVSSFLNVAVWPVLTLAFAQSLAVLYRYAPDRADAEWRWVSWGAGIGVAIWVIASVAFQIYSSRFGSYQEIYGSLAAVVVLLLWLMITCLSILIGAHINAEMEAQTARDTTVDPERPMGQRDATKADHLGRAQ